MANSAPEKGDQTCADEADLFLNAVSDATPLRDRNRAPSARRAGARASAGSDIGTAFAVERDGDFAEGRAHGVSRRQLSDLRAGRIRPEATCDLHGQDVARARSALRTFMAQSARAQRRCVLVIHGRGLHSEREPVLKETVIAWLASGRTPIRGFCSARPRDGGAGALYVLLDEP